MKQKIKGKNCAVFCFAGKGIYLLIDEVITWEKRKKFPKLYYYGASELLAPSLSLAPRN